MTAGPGTTGAPPAVPDDPDVPAQALLEAARRFGTPVAVTSVSALEAAAAEVRAATTIGDEPPPPAPVVLERVAR